MPAAYRAFVIVNPNSSNGGTRRLWPTLALQIRESLGSFEHAFTTGPRHATALARKALEAGFEMVAGVGGDGTHNEVANGFFEKDGRPLRAAAVLGVVPCGTGSDLARTLGIPRSPEGGAKSLAGRGTLAIDVGRVEFMSNEGESVSRFFINIADFGMGGVVVDKVNHASKALGGRLSFLIGTMRGLAAYKNQEMRVELDGGSKVLEGKFQAVVVANGKYFGGGMKIAPEADPSDGLFDVVTLGDLSALESLGLTRSIYSGKAGRHPKVGHARATRVRVTAPGEVLLDVDGEQPGRLPAAIELLPGALQVKVPG